MEGEKNNSIFFKLKNLDKLVARILRFNVEELSEKYDIEVAPSRSQMEILHYILDHMDQCIYQKDLEQALNLRRATISGVLETMEKRRLITRTVDEKDTRTKKITLSTKAKSVYDVGDKYIQKIESRVIIGISEEELQTFFKVIDTIEENLKKEFVEINQEN